MITREQLRLAQERRAKELGLSVEEMYKQLNDHIDYLSSIHTPQCISIFDVERIMDGKDVLSAEGWSHVNSCEYCKKLMPEKRDIYSMTEAEARQILWGYVHDMPVGVVYNGIFDSCFVFHNYYKATPQKFPVITDELTQAYTEKEGTRVEFLLLDYIELEEFFRFKADDMKQKKEALEYLLSIGYKVK